MLSFQSSHDVATSLPIGHRCAKHGFPLRYSSLFASRLNRNMDPHSCENGWRGESVVSDVGLFGFTTRRDYVFGYSPQFRDWRILDSSVFCFKNFGVSAVSWSHHSESRCFVFMRFGVHAAFVIPLPHCSDRHNPRFQISAFSKTARFAISDLRTTKSILDSDPPWMTDLRRDAAPKYYSSQHARTHMTCQKIMHVSQQREEKERERESDK